MKGDSALEANHMRIWAMCLWNNCNSWTAQTQPQSCHSNMHWIFAFSWSYDSVGLMITSYLMSTSSLKIAKYYIVCYLVSWSSWTELNRMPTLCTVDNFLQKMDWPCFQSRYRDTDVENKYMDVKGEVEGEEELGDWDGTYILLILCIK